ncbi:WD repeat-containing protein [Reticulomyxa filosa]|uniref:WD repeat-containing protein n=1 Tax=Reticulomyxa filosa TaxID=46433 RepID=X6NVH3_RETFI|nr:WD repeat-containing protein [Reticulomyxa filosa]|eukprot:ETO29863.1 WD repeat-containing protein [Reticulomyxa filosa]
MCTRVYEYAKKHKKLKGGMQNELEQDKFLVEMKALIRLCGDVVEEEVLRKQLEEANGNVSVVIENMVSRFMSENEMKEKDKKKEIENITEKIEKGKREEEKIDIGETKPGINLQGYCSNKKCLAAKGKLLVWINIGFNEISFVSDKASYSCPDCKGLSVALIEKVKFINSEYSIIASDKSTILENKNIYQSTYVINSGLKYKLKAKKIKQHATNVDDLINRSEQAMKSKEIIKLIKELEDSGIKVVNPPKIKEKQRLLEKIENDYNGDFNQAFDIGRFTILCENITNLKTAVAVMKEAEKFNLIVSEDKNFFEAQSKTHYRVHIIKLYAPNDDVYIEMQATLKKFTTLEGHTVIENAKLSHDLYDINRVWKVNDSTNQKETLFKQASDEILTKINDIFCEWIEEKQIQKISDRYKSHLSIGILKPPQLDYKNSSNINHSTPLKLIEFVYQQLCNFIPSTIKGKAIYVTLYEFYKQYIIERHQPASCFDFSLRLQKSKSQQIQQDVTIVQALETYIPLEANNYPYNENENTDQKYISYDCYEHVMKFLELKEDDKKINERHSNKIMIIQGKSGSGKSLFCRHLEDKLWNNYSFDLKRPIPVFISLPKVYNQYNKEKQDDIILQSLPYKNISKHIINEIRNKLSFIFIMDGFDEIFNSYRNNVNNNKYFYDYFNLNQWNANIVITCRSDVLHDDDIKQMLMGINQNNIPKTTTKMMHLWPFTKQQTYSYIEKFASMLKNNKKNSINININNNVDWDLQQYKETLNNYPNLKRMMEQPFLLQIILTVLPSLTKQYDNGSNLSKTQIYEAFHNYWIDLRVQNLINRLAKLKIQINYKKIKSTFYKYCIDLGFEMFIQGKSIAIEEDIQDEENEKICIKLDPKEEEGEKTEAKKNDVKMETEKSITKNVWEKYFNGDSIAKYILKRVESDKYEFLHKSCQEYYAAQKIILDIILWKPNDINNLNNAQFQKQFESNIHKLLINYKLLNEELGIIQFIAERIHDNNAIYINLKSRLFRIIEASKHNSNINIAASNAITILNFARISLNNQNWNNIKIPYAILDHAFLEGTNLQNAYLNQVSFFQAFLNKVNFSNASMTQRHSSRINEVKFSADDLQIVSCSEDKTIRIWDTLSGKQLKLFEGHTDDVRGIEFSNDNSKILSCSWDKTIRLWDTISGKQIQIFEGHNMYVNAAYFLPNDNTKIISCSDDETIRLWDTISGKQIQIFEKHEGYVKQVQFSPDCSKIVSCSWDKTIRLWDIISGKLMQTFEGHLHPVRNVHFSSDGSKIISCCENTVRIWDIISGKQLQIFEDNFNNVNDAKFSSNDSTIILCSNNIIQILDALSGKQIQILEGHSGSINGIHLSSDGSKIVSCSSDKTIRLWDTSSVQKIPFLEGHKDTINHVKFSSDFSKIASCSKDKTIRIWDTLSGKQLQLFEGHTKDVSGIEFSSDSSKMVSFSSNEIIRLWDTISGKQIQIFEGHNKFINAVHFLPNDNTKIISCSADKTIRLWNVFSGEQIQIFEGHSDEINGIHFSHSNSLQIVSFSMDNTIRLWDISGKQIQIFEGHTACINDVKFLPNDHSKILSCSNDNTIRLWDTLSGKQLQLFKGHSDDIDGITFSSDGLKFLSFSKDKTIRIWDISSENQIQILRGHKNKINFAQFTSDGNKIVSCSNDETIRIWDLSKKQVRILEGHSDYVTKIQLSSDDSKLISCSSDRTIRLWGIDNKMGLIKCIWQSGIQSCGLSMKGSIWENVNVFLKITDVNNFDEIIIFFYIVWKILQKVINNFQFLNSNITQNQSQTIKRNEIRSKYKGDHKFFTAINNRIL